MPEDTKFALVKDVVLRLKRDGLEHVSVDALIDYLAKLGGSPGRQELSAAELEHYKAQLAAWVGRAAVVAHFTVGELHALVRFHSSSDGQGVMGQAHGLHSRSRGRGREDDRRRDRGLGAARHAHPIGDTFPAGCYPR